MKTNNLDWLEQMVDENIASRQPCKSLIEEIMEDIDDLDDEEIGY